MTYKISVIVPVYNDEKYLNRCVDSVINQTIGFENIELILIDDKSTDNTRNIMKDYENNYNNINCIYSNENHGTGVSRNIALSYATGKYIMFLDNDDYYKSNFCEIMYNEIEGTDFNIVGSKFNYEPTNENDDLTSLIINPLENRKYLLDIWMWSKIFKKSFIDKYNVKCSNKIFEDVYFILNCWFNNNGNVKFLPNYCGYYHVLRESPKEKSVSYNFDEKTLIRMFDGLNYNIDYIKTTKFEYVLSDVITNGLIAVFIVAIQNRIKPDVISDYILNFNKNINVKLEFDEKWAQMFYNACINKRYSVIKLLYRIFSFYFNSNFLKRIHRNKF